jgi:hypothetical protein
LEPYSHCDFLYASIRVHIPDELLPTILSISKSIMYDRLKKELTVRCHFMGAIVATMWLVMTLVNNPDKINVIAKEFKNAVVASGQSHNYKKMHSELRKMIQDNQYRYANELAKRECVSTYGSGKTSSLMR